jgi:hypothetical protein
MQRIISQRFVLCPGEKSVLLETEGIMELAHFEQVWYFEIMMMLNFMKFAYELFGYLI